MKIKNLPVQELVKWELSMSIQQLNLHLFYNQSKQREMQMFEHVLVRAKMCREVFAVLLAPAALGLVVTVLRQRLAPSSLPSWPKALEEPLWATHLHRR